jgi:hypothetical protein
MWYAELRSVLHSPGFIAVVPFYFVDVPGRVLFWKDFHDRSKTPPATAAALPIGFNAVADVKLCPPPCSAKRD